MTEETYRKIFDRAIQGIFQCKPNGKFVVVNPAFSGMLGYDSPTEFIAASTERPCRIFVKSSVRDRLLTLLNREGQVTDYECEWLRKDGSSVWASVTVQAVYNDDNRVLYYEGFTTDVTCRKHSENAFRGSETHPRIGIFLTDTSGNCLFVNQRWSDITSLSFESARHLRWVDALDIEGRERVVQGWLAAIDSGKDFSDEFRFRKAGGASVWVSATATALRNSGGIIEGYIGTFVDMTDDRLLETELLQMNYELEDQNRLVQQASRLKSQFLANMSHELRTPLHAIIGFAELMMDGKVGGAMPRVQAEVMGDILRSGHHLLQLINEVLDLSKIEAGKVKFHPEAVDLQRLIGEVLYTLSSLAARKQITLGIHVDAALDCVFVDPSRLKQALYNYASNALKFTAPGGRVAIRGLAEGEDRFRIEVEDNGIGIAEADIPRLFVEFQQLDRGRKPDYQSAGLGLALTKKIVEAQGGSVGVISQAGSGSTFFLALPRVAETTYSSQENEDPTVSTEF